MLSNAEKRFRAEVEKLRQRVTLGLLKDKILKAIGRALAKHPRVARFYQLELVEKQARIYLMLGINWRTAYKTRRTKLKR